MSVKVAVCQVPDVREDVVTSLAWIEQFAMEADSANVSLICFPECFLQGYLTDVIQATQYAIHLSSPVFENILHRLSGYKTIIVFGMIEAESNALFNTAVVIKEGKLLGKYRKTHLLEGEQIFTAGNNYPVFDTGDIKFGINICYDTQFPESPAGIASQGARLILCPSNNMMRHATAEKFKLLHHQMRIERVKETGCWLLSSDVTGERDGRIAYGPTSAINPDGIVVDQVPLMKTGMLVVEI